MKYMPGMRRIVRPRRGQAMLEAAVAFFVLVLAIMGVLQFGLYMHARNVVTGSVQDGARVAASDNSDVPTGVAHARELVSVSLGTTATVNVSGSENGEAVAVVADGSMQPIVPMLAGLRLPLHAEAVVNKEDFHPYGGD